MRIVSSYSNWKRKFQPGIGKGAAAMRASFEQQTTSERFRIQAEKSARIDLGLVPLSASHRPGEALTAADIAAWCDCSSQMISRIEKRALAKVHRRREETEAAALAT